MALSLPPGTDLTKVGLQPNPNGQPPNLIDPPSRANLVLGIGLALSITSALFVSLRLGTNFKFSKKLGLDDYLCLFAEVVMIAYVAMGVSLRDTYKHAYDVPLSTIDDSYAKKAFVLNLIVGPAFWAAKASVLSLYLRLFSIERGVRYGSYAALAVLFLIYWSLIPISVVACSPRPGRAWMTTLERCSNDTKVYGPIHGACGTAADIYILCLPLPVLKSLRLPKAKKIGLFVVFATGIFAIIASAVALYYRAMIFKSWDTWRVGPLYIAAYFECFITIIVSCAPAVYSFWTNYFTTSSLYASFRSGFSSQSSRFASGKNTESFGRSKDASSSYLRFTKSTSSITSNSKQPILVQEDHSEAHIPLHSISRGQKSITKSTGD